VTRGLGRLRAVLLASAVASSVAALAALAPGSPLASTCAGAGPHHAALVVEHGDGSVVSRCVSFDAVSVTGEQLLNSSGVAWSGQSYGGFGDAVCAVDAEPAHYSTCPGKDNYWAVFVSRGGGGWQLASVGISTMTLGDDDAEGLRYVPAVGDPVAPPPPIGVCGAAVASASAGGSDGPTGTVGPTSAVVTPAAPIAATPAASLGEPGGAGSAAAAGSLAPALGSVTGGQLGTSPGASSGEQGGVSPRPDAAPPPGNGSGIDPGLLAAALVGGGLAGLALLRLSLSRRRAP
jgi:hypothetical protein